MTIEKIAEQTYDFARSLLLRDGIVVPEWLDASEEERSDQLQWVQNRIAGAWVDWLPVGGEDNPLPLALLDRLIGEWRDQQAQGAKKGGSR